MKVSFNRRERNILIKFFNILGYNGEKSIQEQIDLIEYTSYICTRQFNDNTYENRKNARKLVGFMWYDADQDSWEVCHDRWTME